MEEQAQQQLQKNDIIEAEIIGLDYKGDGVAKVGGIPVFVAGGLAGEVVRAKIIYVKRNFYIGLLMSVLTPSAERVQPKCEYFGKCGGCDLQHMDYAAQLSYKEQAVRSTWKSVSGAECEITAVHGSVEQYGYRNKLSLPVRSHNGVNKVGFFASGSHRIVQVAHCPLQRSELDRPLAVFVEWLDGKSCYDEERGSGDVRHVVVRLAGDVLTMTVVCTRVIDLSRLNEALSKLGVRYALYININAGRSNVIFGVATRLVGGSEYKSEVHGVSTFVHPLAFLQVNENVAMDIYNRAVELTAGKAVLDAYCGGGMLTAMLGHTAERVLGVEICPESISSAVSLVRDNGIDNVEFICGDCAEVLPRLKGDKFDAIVLDPPRSGCDERVLCQVEKFGAESIVYISCNPATLARDVSRLSGYRLVSIELFDMFPQTKHVEALAYLVKG